MDFAGWTLTCPLVQSPHADLTGPGLDNAPPHQAGETHAGAGHSRYRAHLRFQSPAAAGIDLDEDEQPNGFTESVNSQALAQ